jgi:hypothetical protein
MLANTQRVRGDTQRLWLDHDAHDQDRLPDVRRDGRPFDDLEQSFFEAEVDDDTSPRAGRAGSSTALPAIQGADPLDDEDDARAFTARKRANRMRLGGLVAAGLAAGALVGFGVPRLAARIHGAPGTLPAASITSVAPPVAAAPAKQPSPSASAAPAVPAMEVTVPEVPDPAPIGGAAAAAKARAAAAPAEERQGDGEPAPLKDVVWSESQQALVPANGAPAAVTAPAASEWTAPAAEPAPAPVPEPAPATELEQAPARP